MNNLDLLELEQKIHHWCGVIGNAAVAHGWEFAVGFDSTPHEHWPGLSMNEAVLQKMADIVLDDKSSTPLRTRIEVMDEACVYIAKVVAEKNFPKRVLVGEPGSKKPKLSFTKLAEYIHDVYFVNLHARSRIQEILVTNMNAEAQQMLKNKI